MILRRTSALVIGVVGLVAAGLVGSAPTELAVADSEPPIVERLEFEPAGVLSYAGGIAGDFKGGQIETNELFVRYLPETGFAEVFISLMLVGEYDGCPSSMHALNQTTAEPVPIAADGTATATIDAQWVWDGQELAGGVCFEKVVHSRWTETYSIDLRFVGGSAGAVIGYGDQVESLGSLPTDQPAVTTAPTESGEAVTGGAVTPGVAAGAPPSEFGESTGDTDDVGESRETAGPTEASDVEASAAADDGGGGIGRLSAIALMIAVVLILWAWFFTDSLAKLRDILTGAIRQIAETARLKRSLPEPQEAPADSDIKVYGEGDQAIAFQTTVEPVPPAPPPQVFEIMGTSDSGFSYVEGRTDDDHQAHRLETGTKVHVLRREGYRAYVRPVGGDTPVWIDRRDLQALHPDVEPSN